MARDDDRSVALTPMQRAFWATQRRRPNDPVFNMALVVDLGPVADIDTWVAGFDEVVRRSPVLHSVIGDTQNGPRWIAVPERPTSDVVDLPRTDLASWAQERIRTPLDASTCTYDSVFVRHPDGTASWYLDVHHVSVDGSAFVAIYAATRALALGQEPQRAEDFHDWIDARHARSAGPGRRQDAARAHWSAVDWPEPVGRLYGGRAVADGTSSASRHLVDGGADVTLPESLGGINDSMRWTTALATVAAAWVALVADTDAVTLGIPVHHRRTSAARQVIGPLVEIAPVAVQVDRTRSIVELHTDVATAVMEALTHAQPGLIPARAVDVLVNVVPDGVFRPEDEGWEPHAPIWLHNGHLEPTLLGQLQLTPYDGGELIVDVNDSVAPPTPQRCADHVGALLRALADERTTELRALDLRGAAEARAIAAWSDGGASDAPPLLDALRRSLVDGGVHGLPSVEGGHGRVVAGPELLAAAESVASHLIADGVQPGDRVATDIVRSVEAIVAPLGIWLAGASWVPLEPSHPSTRRADLYQRSGAVVLLDRERVAAAASVGHAPTMLPGLTPDAEAYLLFTSGSTGTPKGVPITHHGLSVYIHNAMRHLEIEHPAGPAPLIASLLSTMSFDITLTPMLVPLLAGGRVVPIEEDGRDGLLAVAARTDLTYVRGTPSHLDVLCRLDPASPVQRVIVCGERFSTALAHRLRATFGDDVIIVNEYGPTESVVACAEEVVTSTDELAADGDLAIGRPHPGTQLRIVAGPHDGDRQDAPVIDVPVGAHGELWIASEGLTQGYLDSADDIGRFVEHDGLRWYRTGDLARLGDDGACWCLGRLDDQMKVGGVRVEPAEIEAALGTHPDVTTSVARLVDLGERSTLVAWVVPRTGATIDADAVRAHAASILHRAVVPAHVVAVSELPRTANGKIDTTTLRSQFAASFVGGPPPQVEDEPSPLGDTVPTSGEVDAAPTFGGVAAAPTSGEVATVLRAMGDLLGGRHVRPDDNFFDVGGDSLAGLDLAALLRDQGYELDDAVVFESVTARAIAERMVPTAEAPVPVRPKHLPPPLTPGEASLLYEHGNAPDDPRYQVGRRMLVGTVGAPAELDLDRFAMAVQSVVSRHPSFTWTYGTPRQRRRADALVELHLATAGSSESTDLGDFDAQLADLQRRPFDPTSHEPPLRLLVRRLRDGRVAVGLAAHHVSLDATTFDVLWEQVDHEYSGRPGPDLSGPDLADLLQRTSDLDVPANTARLDRWLHRTDRRTAELDLGRPVVHRDGLVRRPLGLPIDQVASGDGTAFATVLAAFACALRRRADGDCIGVGVIATMRDHAAMRDQLGYHMNTLPLVVDTDAPTLAAVVERCGELSTDALVDRATPIAQVASALRSGSGPRGEATEPALGAMLAFERYAPAEIAGQPVEASATWAGSAVTDVTLFCHVKGDDATLELEYSGAVLDEAGAEALLDDVATFVDLAASGAPIDHLTAPLPSDAPVEPDVADTQPTPLPGRSIGGIDPPRPRGCGGRSRPDLGGA